MNRNMTISSVTPDYLMHLGWKNCYSSCGRECNMRWREVKCEKLLLYLQGEVQGGCYCCAEFTLHDRPLYYVWLM